MKKNKKSSIVLAIVWPVVSFGIIFLLWYYAVHFGGMASKLPDPIKVFKKMFEWFTKPIGKYTLLGHIWFSLRRVLVSYCVALVAGVVIGIGMGWSKMIRAIVNPIFTVIRSIPSLAWIPLAIMWFGVDEASKYFIIGLAAFVTITVNAYGGVGTVDMQLVGAARMLGANNRQVFFKIVLPSALPSIFAGMQVGISTSWMAMLAAEMIRSYEGLGWMIIMGMESSDLVQIVVGIITIGVMGLILANIIKLIERRATRWKKTSL